MLIVKIKMVNSNLWKKNSKKEMKIKKNMTEMKIRKSFNKMTKTLTKTKNMMINQREEEEAERKDDSKVFLNF